jgi:quercetin dioxygenase-like cupin family protein
MRVDFQSLPWESPASGMRFKAAVHGGRRLRIVEIEQGFVEGDWCEKAHAGYVVEGSIEIDLPRERLRFRSGDGLFFPSGMKHRLSATLEPTVLFLVEDP